MKLVWIFNKTAVGYISSKSRCDILIATCVCVCVWLNVLTKIVSYYILYIYIYLQWAWGVGGYVTAMLPWLCNISKSNSCLLQNYFAKTGLSKEELHAKPKLNMFVHYQNYQHFLFYLFFFFWKNNVIILKQIVWETQTCR